VISPCGFCSLLPERRDVSQDPVASGFHEPELSHAHGRGPVAPDRHADGRKRFGKATLRADRSAMRGRGTPGTSHWRASTGPGCCRSHAHRGGCNSLRRAYTWRSARKGRSKRRFLEKSVGLNCGHHLFPGGLIRSDAHAIPGANEGQAQ
jgi:hypothetical protein